MSTAPRKLRELLVRPGIIRSIAPHDAFTARVLEKAGIELLFLGGFGVSASLLGMPDLSLLTLTEMSDTVRRITGTVRAPLIADGDTGHGGLANVARTVREFERAGAAGMLLEDQVFPKRCGHFVGKQVIPTTEMLDKLRAALDARTDPDFVLLARTDALAIEGVDAAIERANRYAELGADMCFVEAPRSRDELARIAREIPKPQLANMLLGGNTPILSANELQTLGFKVMVDPVVTLMATAFVTRRLADALQNTGRLDSAMSELLSFDELKTLLGVPHAERGT